MNPRAKVFTYDAKLMYTDIPTEYALEVISEYIGDNQAKYGHYHAPTLIESLEIVMHNNIMKFGNEFRKHSAGTAMGKPPVPAWSTLFKRLHEIDFFPQDGNTF